MAWRFNGRARVSPSRPSAFAICDRCNLLYNHVDLRWQPQWAGTRQQNLNLLVCSRCWDVPQPQLKARILPPDPMPIRNPRPQDYNTANNTFIVTDEGDRISTDDDENIITG